MKLATTVTHFVDPGHGWYKVSFAELDALGLIDSISNCSTLTDKGWAYLEEDGDATAYFNARQAAGGEPNVTTRYADKRCACYNYAPYQADYVRRWLEWKRSQ